MSAKPSNIEVKREPTASAPTQAEGWTPLMSLRGEIDRLFDDFGAGLWHRPFSRRLHDLFPAADTWAVIPAMELADCDGDYRITAELPGLMPEDVEIKLANGSIVIRGEKSEEKKEEKENYLLKERRYGSFHRSLPLPPGVDVDGISASVSNGVLTVTLPKSAEAKQQERKIKVNAA
ncbi:Hsp20/alpha crystallin family protein [Stappia indica]|uniref:Hsp20/alpha crystallin family protein n=1 Tax=Stappia indica TaxID=538381 RepID=UPI001CD3B5C2|nr:Hsp20/alpha crystallin family protein [Stappia indica]MCA1297323.1 Hsp20/alpha crystallin family protein [Stappia indica]